MRKLVISFSLFFLCLGVSGQALFGYFGAHSYRGNQRHRIKDANLDLSTPYEITFAFEGHYVTDDIYYIGKALGTLYGKHSYDVDGERVGVLNGNVIDFSLGAASGSDNFATGYGIRSNFSFNGLRAYDGEVNTFAMGIGPEFVASMGGGITRLYGRTSLMNMWSELGIFNGFGYDATIDLHLYPIPFVLLGAGVGYSLYSQNIKFDGAEMRYGVRTLYYHFVIAFHLLDS